MRVLILEDEALIAALLVDWMAELGHEVVGPVATTAAALAIEPAAIDVALLDLHVRDGDSYGVATRLAASRIPFAFASGSGPEELGDGFRGSPVLSKPFCFEDLEGLLRRWEQSRRSR
mgnify:CR=1 FL=1